LGYISILSFEIEALIIGPEIVRRTKISCQSPYYTYSIRLIPGSKALFLLPFRASLRKGKNKKGKTKNKNKRWKKKKIKKKKKERKNEKKKKKKKKEEKKRRGEVCF